MDTSPIDTLLRRSAPRGASDDPGVTGELDRIALAARVTATRGRRIRRLSWVAVPVLAVPVFAFASTAGTDPRLVPDFEIPVSYVTDTGREIECSIEMFNGEMNYVETNVEAVEYMRAQDWDGVGQRIYDRALEIEAVGGISPWQVAENDALMAGAPDDLFLNGGMGIESTCTGELH
ncbi:hypothetical protein AB0N73_03195 [Microbacterium sp. NPDC089189]|uniref:hypothetical protein n=1 Tax=Microbacterium sp. NPDC089189 TaxID=3154972 RepID=UPI0034398951